MADRRITVEVTIEAESVTKALGAVLGRLEEGGLQVLRAAGDVAYDDESRMALEEGHRVDWEPSRGLADLAEAGVTLQQATTGEVAGHVPSAGTD